MKKTDCIHGVRIIHHADGSGLSIEPDNKGIKDVLVITDHFTKYAHAIITHNQTAKVVAETLRENLICNYGWPCRLHSDQGRDFESRVISELCKMGRNHKNKDIPLSSTRESG